MLAKFIVRAIFAALGLWAQRNRPLLEEARARFDAAGG